MASDNSVTVNLLSQFRQHNQSRTGVYSSRRVAWAFTHLRLTGCLPLGIPKGDARLSKNASET